MNRPHRWTLRQMKTALPGIDRAAHRLQHDEEASEAFAALEWVLGQVWRTVAWSRLIGDRTVRVGQYLVCCGREDGGGSWVVEWCGADRIWTRQLVGDDISGDEYTAVAAALAMIERLGS